MRKFAAAAAVAALITISESSAQERIIFGTRALAMGGTTVAASSDASAAFGNPAAFAMEEDLSRWDFTFPLAVLQFDLNGDVVAVADEIADDYDSFNLFNIQTRLNNGSVTTSERRTVLKTFLYDVPRLDEPGSGMTARLSLGPAFRFGNWGFSAAALLYAGIRPVVDLGSGLSLGTGGFSSAIPSTPDNCGSSPFCTSFASSLVATAGAAGGTLTNAQAQQLVVDAGPNRLQSDPAARSILQDMVRQTASGGITLADNLSGVDVVGLLIKQYAFTYSRLLMDGKLSVGGNAKLMQGETYIQGFVVNDIERGDDLIDELDNRENTETSTAVGLDLGVMYRPIRSLRLGVTGQNLNKPEFDFVGGLGAYELDPLVRVGAAWRPTRWLMLAGDLDVTEIDSQILNGGRFQYASLGAEFIVLRFLDLRAGTYKNLSDNGGGPVWTGGLGLNFGPFQMDLAFAVATDDQAVEAGPDPDTYPTGGGVGISFGWKSRVPSAGARP